MKKGIIMSLSALLTAGLIAGCGQKQSTSEEKEAKFTPLMEKEIKKEVARLEKPKATGEGIIVADFDSGEKPNNINGDFGAWDKDPADFSQGCVESFDSINRHGSKGFAMKIDYDVDSQNPAYNGFWMFLQNLDASKYENLSFWVKGDQEHGYTTVFKVELKNTNKQVGRFYVTNVTGEWQNVVIPLNQFKGITDFSGLTEFVIVFEDRIASNKDGVIYIDDIAFTK